MMRTGKMVLVGLGVSALALGACGGTQIPQHSGYKSTKSKPWKKPKTIKLDDDYKGKITAELDYASFKRARWYAVDLPGPGTLDVSMEVIPGGPERDDDDQMDVGVEILDEKFNVLSKSDLENGEDARELKKERSLKELPEGRYLIHLYLEGRLDSADVDLKVVFTKGDLPWKSDFPNQVAYVGALPAVPVLDDTPEAPKRPRHPRHPRHPRQPRNPPPKDPPPQPTAGSVVVGITDVQASGSGATIVIGGGTSEGLSNGLVGSVRGVRNSTFKLSGCSSSTCKARVKASADDVRASGKVLIRLVLAPSP